MAQGQDEIATYHNERFGFRLSYPAARFKPKESLSEEIRMRVSDDGHERLLAGALPNGGAMNLKDYRAFVLKESYAGADIAYAPVRDTWRVTFACGGRLINSWAMLYPASEREVYNRVVEQVARSYRAGQSKCG